MQIQIVKMRFFNLQKLKIRNDSLFAISLYSLNDYNFDEKTKKISFFFVIVTRVCKFVAWR